MVRLNMGGGFVMGGRIADDGGGLSAAEAKRNTIAYGILNEHSCAAEGEPLRIKFDALASHDITYVNVIQTARASGLEKFPAPYVLTNCHNSLCAVGGTINEDDHAFGFSACVKYGGVFVPAHLAVIHTFMREMYAGSGKMILGTDSHTRYGALGTLAIGEGGGEVVKQLLGKRYEIAMPEVVGVELTGKLSHGVGPHDVALALIKSTFACGFAKNRILEFFGSGVSNLSMDFRNGIDVMTTETTCLSSIWQTDEKTREFLAIHGRENDYSELKPGGASNAAAFYDRLIMIDLSKTEPMIALPFHPSNVYTIREFNKNAKEVLNDTRLAAKIRDGGVWADQGSIVGCAGGSYENIMGASAILDGKRAGCGQFALSIYPGSQPINIAITENGAHTKLLESGAITRTAFCGPCFGAGDTPKNGGLSVRHATRNFENREGAKPGDGQNAGVALMDARSIAATAANGGRITGADEIAYNTDMPRYRFNRSPYDKRVYNGWEYGADRAYALSFGPNITDWPPMAPLADDMLLFIAAYLDDAVTTTDELIPSGETSSYRSNPLRLAEYTLSRRCPRYVSKAKAAQKWEAARQNGVAAIEVSRIIIEAGIDMARCAIGSAIFARKPGDGSAREQAASCQRVLGGLANIAGEYATKRYMSNLINWGIVPFISDSERVFAEGDFLYIGGVRTAIESGEEKIAAQVFSADGVIKVTFDLTIPRLTAEQRRVLLAGSVINDNNNQ